MVLTCIGWVAWAAFTFSVLVELVAVLRRRSAPRIRGLGGMQSLASFLIGGIVLLAPTAASAATVTPAVAATATHTAGQDTGSASAKHEKTRTDGAGLRHTVTSATESPWELAQTYLGSGLRWKDIAALNPDIPELAMRRPVPAQGRDHHAARRCPTPSCNQHRFRFCLFRRQGRHHNQRAERTGRGCLPDVVHRPVGRRPDKDR